MLNPPTPSTITFGIIYSNKYLTYYYILGRNDLFNNNNSKTLQQTYIMVNGFTSDLFSLPLYVRIIINWWKIHARKLWIPASVIETIYKMRIMFSLAINLCARFICGVYRRINIKGKCNVLRLVQRFTKPRDQQSQAKLGAHVFRYAYICG